MIKLLISLLLALPAIGQVKLTFEPIDSYRISNTVWNITACVDPKSPGMTLRAGDIYAQMIARRLSYLTQSQATAVLQSVPERSLGGKLVKYGGWAAAGFSTLLGFSVVKASTAITGGVTAASAVINAAVPLAQKNEPAVPVDVQSNLLGPFLVIPDKGCSQTIVVGGQGAAFEVSI